MSGKVFICYRRDDSAGSTGRLYDHIAGDLGPESVFMDIDTIEPGQDFIVTIEDSVAACDVFLAVIGPRWLHSEDSHGRRRLDSPEDFVRLELSTALRRDIRVIPVLVEGASMPRSDDLPGDLGHFARRQALEIRHNSFNSDTEKLLGTLNRLIQQDQTKDGSDGQTLGHQAHRESASQTIDDTSIQYFTVSKESRERILRVLIDGTSHTIEYKVPFFDMLNWATIKLDGEIIYRTKSIPTNVNFLIPGPGQHYSANITATTHRINVISSFRLTIGGLTVYED